MPSEAVWRPSWDLKTRLSFAGLHSFLLNWHAGDPWFSLTLSALLAQKSSPPGRPVLSVFPFHALSGSFFLAEAGASMWWRKISIHSQDLGLTYGSVLDGPSSLLNLNLLMCDMEALLTTSKVRSGRTKGIASLES